MVIQLEGVTVTYSSPEEFHALSDVDLDVEEGELLTIMGPSGSGKTTLLRVSSGSLRPSKGSVKLLGQNIYEIPIGQRLKFLRENISITFQEDYVIDTLNVFENIELPLIIDGRSKKERSESVSYALELVRLEGLEKRLPSQLSGGELRKVSIARSLVRNPKFLFLDEPTSNLDTDNALNILEIIKGINKNGVTVLLSTHDPFLVKDLKRIISIRDGKILSD